MNLTKTSPPQEALMTQRKNSFHMASPEEIKSGHVTDIYFQRARQILQKKNIECAWKLR